MENSTKQFNETTENQPSNQSADNKEITINQKKLERYLDKLKLEQNLPLGIIAGLFAAIAGALVWAVIIVSTGYQIGYMAMAIGFLVGYAIKNTGKGIDKIFGISGAILSLFGCLLGNFLGIVGFVANSEGLSYFKTLTAIDYSLIPELMTASFSPIDLLFYGIAVYQGYKFSFRQIKEQEIIDNATDKVQ